MMTRPMPGCFWSVPRSIEMNTSICPVRRSWALKLLPETRPAYGSYLSQSISLVASLNTPEKVSSVRLMNGPSASRTNLLVEALWLCPSPLRNDAAGWAMNSCRAFSRRRPGRTRGHNTRLTGRAGHRQAAVLLHDRPHGRQLNVLVRADRLGRRVGRGE